MSEPQIDCCCGRRVLVVESDGETARALRDELSAAGCEVCWDSSVNEFRQRDDITSFSAILIDRCFIDDVLPRSQAVVPPLPVIVMSNRSDVRAAVSTIQRGAADYILKPVPANELKITLANVLAQQEKTEAYHREKAFSDNLLDLVPAIIVILDGAGRIIRFNRFMEQLSGYRLEEVKGRNWFETFLTAQDQPHVRDTVEKALAETGSNVSGNVTPIVTRSGEHRQISWRCTAFQNIQDGATNILATGQDVTDLLAAQEKASQSRRLATIGQTVATLSHETRNELHALNMGLELLPEVLDDRDEALEIIESLKHEQARLFRLFEDVRGFAAPMRLEPMNHGLAEIWRNAWNSIENARQERDAILREHIDAPTVQCVVDGFRLEQVFRNLFENSLAACSDPVKIDVTCSRTERNQREALQISVRDNGPGLPDDQRETIFDAFVTTKQEGTGLGLALTKRVIEAHQGSIELVSQSGRGAEFIITLPVVNAIEENSLDAMSVTK